MLPTKFRFIWPSGFRQFLKKSTNQKQELPVAAMLVNGSEINEQSLLRTFQGCFLPNFDSFGAKRLQRKRFFRNQPIRNKKLSVAAMLVNGSEINEQYLLRTFQGCILPGFNSFGKAVSEEKIFKNRPIRNKNCLWWPCLLTDRNERSILHLEDLPRMHPIELRFIWQSGFRGDDFLEINQSETRIVCGGHVCKQIRTK